MSEQDRDVLVVCLVAGFGLASALTGLYWSVSGLHALIKRRSA